MGELSETAVIAVGATADAYVDFPGFSVPAGMKRIKKVEFQLGPDFAVDTSIRIGTVARIRGSGIGEQDPHEFLGPFGGQGDVTQGSLVLQGLSQEYDVDIPVQPGGPFTVSIMNLTEIVPAGTYTCKVTYDEKAPTAKCAMSNYASAAQAAAADVWAALGTVVVPQPKAGAAPTRIKKLGLGIAIDQGTGAILLRLNTRFRLTGAGLVQSGGHEYLGPSGASMSDTDGCYPYDRMLKLVDVDIPVNPGGTITIEQRLDGELQTAATLAVGLLYE